jgi:uncharacterized protein YecT (DUF1311 family)
MCDMRTFLPLALLLLSSFAVAQDETIPACAEWVDHPLPAEAQAKPDPGCGSDALIRARDYAAARACAWAERSESAAEQAVFGGAASLSTIYASGLGVPRDYALARRMVCEAGGAYAEVEGRLEHVAAMEAGNDREALDFCDDITSGYMMGFCAQRAAELASAARAQIWSELLAEWPAAHRDAWKTLRKAADVFFEQRVAGEVDASGTGRGAFIVGETEALEIALLDSVRAFERGELPTATEADFAEADRRLNESYAAARAAAKWEDPQGLFGPLGSITPDGIRDAERAWIKYRDAWVRFGAVRWPAVAPIAWQHYFTVQREKQLREVYGEG